MDLGRGIHEQIDDGRMQVVAHDEVGGRGQQLDVAIGAVGGDVDGAAHQGP